MKFGEFSYNVPQLNSKKEITSKFYRDISFVYYFFCEKQLPDHQSKRFLPNEKAYEKVKVYENKFIKINDFVNDLKTRVQLINKTKHADS